MTAGMVKRPPDGVVVVSSTLSGEERSELQAFLESQPEVQEVRRVWHNVRTRDSYEDRLTLGLVVAAPRGILFSRRPTLDDFRR